MLPPARPSRDNANRHATLLLLVVLVVAASPGVFKAGMLTSARAGQDRISQTAGDGEVRLVRAEPRDETRPTPAEVRQSQLDRTFVHHRTGMPFRVALTQTNVDRRPGSGGVVLLSSVALPPPRG